VQNVKKMPLAGVNIARVVALVEDCFCFRYAANIMLLRLLLLVVTELLAGFKKLVSTQEDLDLVEKEQTHRDDRFGNNNGVPLFLPVSLVFSKVFLKPWSKIGEPKRDKLPRSQILISGAKF
jgi:hypothetical protein